MNRWLQIYKKIILFVLAFCSFSCYSYQSIQSPNRLILKTNNNTNEIIIIEEKKYSTKYIKYYTLKYLTKIYNNSPISELNNKAIESFLLREYREALIIFEQALVEKQFQAVIYNNLGVTYEFLEDENKAFEMYSSACMIEPDNKYFRSNLLSLKDF